MNELDRASARANERRLVQHFIKDGGVKDQFHKHVQSILFHCRGDVEQMRLSMTQLYRNQPGFFH